MAGSFLARAIFFGTKPNHSQITHSLLRHSLPPVRNYPCRAPPGLLYSTKPTTEAVHARKSSTTSTDVQSSSPATSISKALSSSLNPPPTARPPPFTLPVRQPNKTLAYYYALGKASLSFYKTGIKAIYKNYKLTRSIRARLSGKASSIPRTQLLEQGLISRGEYHLLQRTAADSARIPLFALIFLVFGEWTPLVVVAFSSAVPRTLWIPKQVQKAQEKQQQRRRGALSKWQGPLPSNFNNPTKLQPAKREAVLLAGRILGAYPAWWDRLPWLPVSAVARRVHQHLHEIEVDDLAIQRGGGVREVEDEEVSMAAEKRGLNVLDRDVKEVRRDLETWLRHRKELGVEGILSSSLFEKH